VNCNISANLKPRNK